VPLAFSPYLLMRLEGLTAAQLPVAALAGGFMWAAAAAAALYSGRQRLELYLLFLLAPVAFGPGLSSEIRVFRLNGGPNLGLADHLAAQGQSLGGSEKALEKYKLSLALNPWKYATYLKRGDTYMALERPVEGLQDFETALKIAPQEGDPHFYLGKYYFFKGQMEPAARHFDEAIRLNPNFNGYYQERARLYAFTAQPDKARADIEKALEVCPSCALGILHSHGFFCLNAGLLPEAVDYFTRAAALPGAPAEAYLNRATAYYALKRYAEAAADCDKAVAIRPAVFGVYGLRAQVRLRLNRQKEALEDYAAAIAQRASSEDYLQRAIANFYFKRDAEARADAAKAVELSHASMAPNTGIPYAFNARGWAYLWAGEWEKARADFEKTISMDPAIPHSYGNMANYYWAHKKDKQKALEYLELEFQRGFVQWDVLTSELGDGYFLKGLNTAPEFKALVAKYRK
jgi:tetratricopeptide (TPR) repeat protein